MTDIDFRSGRKEWPDMSEASAPPPARPKICNPFCLKTAVLAVMAALLFFGGMACSQTTHLPDWAGLAAMTSALVIVLFLAGRHS